MAVGMYIVKMHINDDNRYVDIISNYKKLLAINEKFFELDP
jgi:hypothetical protein